MLDITWSDAEKMMVNVISIVDTLVDKNNTNIWSNLSSNEKEARKQNNCKLIKNKKSKLLHDTLVIVHQYLKIKEFKN